MAFLAFGPLFFASPALADEVVEPTVIVVTTPGGDDSSYQVPMTTTVTFDGVTYDSVYATTNSVITFGRPDGTYWDFPQTPSISLYSMDWVVYPQWRTDEHLIIRSSDGGFQVDISARPIWLQNAVEPTNINIVAAINTDGTVAISYSLTGPTYDQQTRTGVRLTNGTVVSLEQYGIVQVEEAPVLEPEPVTPTPTPTPTPEPTPTPPPAPFVPEGATLLSEGSTLEVVAPEGQRIVSITAWYGDPADGSRGVEVSSTLTELASGQTSVTIESSNIYGDPAPGTVKTLIFVVAYEPLPAPPAPAPQPEPYNPPQPEVPVEPAPEPTLPPEEEPAPAPAPAPEPPEEPAPPIAEPTPEPEPVMPVPEPTEEPAPITEAEVMAELAAAAQANDPELPAELAAIPLIGEALGAALEIFNDIGNLGSDMTPEVREQAEKTVVASVIVGQVATSAAASAAVSASAASTRKIK